MKTGSTWVHRNRGAEAPCFQAGEEVPPALLLLTPFAGGILSDRTDVLVIGARLMSAQEPPPTEAAARKRTPSFLCEVPLRVMPREERVLLVQLEAARQLYNACLGEAKRRVGLVRQSRAFQRARALPKDDPARRILFAEARAASACSEYDLHASAAALRQSWLGEHLDSNTGQKLASRAHGAARRLLSAQGPGAFPG